MAKVHHAKTLWVGIGIIEIVIRHGANDADARIAESADDRAFVQEPPLSTLCLKMLGLLLVVPLVTRISSASAVIGEWLSHTPVSILRHHRQCGLPESERLAKEISGLTGSRLNSCITIIAVVVNHVAIWNSSLSHIVLSRHLLVAPSPGGGRRRLEHDDVNDDTSSQYNLQWLSGSRGAEGYVV